MRSQETGTFQLRWLAIGFISLQITGSGVSAAEAPAPEGSAPSQNPSLEPQEQTPLSLEMLARRLEEQGRLIESQANEIAQLKARLDETRELSLSASNRLDNLQQKQQEPAVPSALEKRLAELEHTVQRTPEMPTPVGEGFANSFPIPGSDAAIKFGGQVRTTLVHTADALGTDLSFVTSAIPVEGSEEAGKGPRFTFSARPSRTSIDFRAPTAVGPLRAFIEADFAGDGNAFRLRHAFGQWSNFVIGRTWSTFSDPEAEPDGIDFEGLNAISLFRQVQFRWTKPLRKELAFSLAIEDPAPSVTGANGVSLTPDVIARLRWEPGVRETVPGLLERLDHVQAAVLARTIRAEPFDKPNQTLTTGGLGGTVSGVLAPRWDRDDRVKFAAYFGTGIGRYITDLGTLGGQDAVYDEATNTIKPLRAFATYFGYERLWKPTFRSTFTYGVVDVENLDLQSGDALRWTQRTSFNIAWSPIPRIDIVLEFLSGWRVNKDGRRGTAKQVQAGWNYRF